MTSAKELTFLEALGVLQDWLGKEVEVHVEPAAGPTQGIAAFRGTLGTDADMATPPDDEEFRFTVGESGWFTAHREYVGNEIDQDDNEITLVHEQWVLIHVRLLDIVRAPGQGDHVQ